MRKAWQEPSEIRCSEVNSYFFSNQRPPCDIAYSATASPPTDKIRSATSLPTPLFSKNTTQVVSTQHIIAPRTLPRLIPPRERQLKAKTVFNQSYLGVLSVTFTSHGRAYPVGLPYLEGYWCIQCCSSIRELACICAVRFTCSEDTVLPRLTTSADLKAISAAVHTPQTASSLPGQTLRSMLTHSLRNENSTNNSLQSLSRRCICRPR